MKVLLIANPISGLGRGREHSRALAAALATGGARVDLRFTAAAGDARRWAQDVEPDVDRLVVAGGDGTLSEVVNGINLGQPPAVAVIPLGTGNVLARELRLPRQVAAQCRMILGDQTCRFDLPAVGSRRFLTMASCGFDACVVDQTTRARKGPLGFRGYVAPVLRTLRDYQCPEITVQVDDRMTLHGAMVVVSKTRNYGALFTVCPDARCDSGDLAVCVLEAGRPLELLMQAGLAFAGMLHHLPGVTLLRGRRVRIATDEPLPIQADGDLVGATPAVVELASGTLDILVPGQ